MKGSQTRETVDAAQVRSWLAGIRDPEMPYISIADLGIVRDVCEDTDGRIRIAITPTHSGCPANRAIRNEIVSVMQNHDVSDFVVETWLSPPWTTDWITPAGRAALHDAGIAPPQPAASPAADAQGAAQRSVPPCPRCGSSDTLRLGLFGSTACRAPARCRSCGDSFEFLKCV